jgi:TetR/AcrR family transcriptional regulator, transcriptional repressor for nem operon
MFREWHLRLGPIGPSFPRVNTRRAQILDAAAVLIGRQGYSATSIDDVIKESRLSGKSHFYHYFRSKEELGFEVLDRQFERFAERGLAILREPMIDPLERLHLFIDSLVAAHAARGCHGGSPFGTLAAEMADAHEGFRLRIAAVFLRWASQIQSLLWEARPQLQEDVDAVRLSRFIIAALEGGLMMSRVKRDITVMEGIAADLKRFIGSYVKDAQVLVHPEIGV